MPNKGKQLKPRNFKCEVCGQALRIKPSRLQRQTKRYRPRYCSFKCKGEAMTARVFARIEREHGKPMRDVLLELYCERQMSGRQTAAALNVSLRSLWKWLADFNIPVRRGSEAVKLQWKDNDTRKKAFAESTRRWMKENPEKARQMGVKAMLANQEKRGATDIERIMMEALDARGFDYVYQLPVGDKFLCDFAFPHAQLIVECDGDYWHDKPERKRLDASKDAYLRACGFTVLRLRGSAIKTDLDGCVDKVASHLSVDTHARMCAANSL